MTWFSKHKDKDEDIVHGPQQNGRDNLPVPASLTNPYYRHNDDDDDDWGDWETRMARFTNGFDGNYGYQSNYSYKPRTEKDYEAYDFLKDYSKVFNLFSASTPQITPYSNHAIYIIDILSKLGIKFRVDVFNYSGGDYSNPATDTTAHRLINIIAEPNHQVPGPAIVFSAHHDVANPRSENCQDNGASVCHLLRLAAMIAENPEASQRTLLVFTDCEESGAKGARRFADGKVNSYDRKNDKKSDTVEHKIFGEISGVIILELTGHGDVVWTDCDAKEQNVRLHRHLEKAAKKSLPKVHTPPSDVISFRSKDYPALCIGTLPNEDMRAKATWGQCHRMSDNIEGCDEKDMKVFTEFLLEVSRVAKAAPTEPPNTQLTLELQD